MSSENVCKLKTRRRRRKRLTNLSITSAMLMSMSSLVSAAISSANTPRQSPFCGKTKGGLEPAEPYASYAPVGTLKFCGNR